jgi:hypothetical protein
VNIADPRDPGRLPGDRGAAGGGRAGPSSRGVFDAIGVYINRTPLTPDKILNAIEGGSPGYTTLQTNV